MVTVSRTGSADSPLMVEYTIAGSAINGVDFHRLPGRVTIPAGAHSVTFPVQAINDGEEEAAENVQLALASNLRPFTIIIVPDTQLYTHQYVNNLDMFASQIRWIVDQKDATRSPNGPTLNATCACSMGWSLTLSPLAIMTGWIPRWRIRRCSTNSSR
jgi:hypothetical protein